MSITHTQPKSQQQQPQQQKDLPEWMKWTLSILIILVWCGLWIGGVLWVFSALHWLVGPIGWVIGIVIAVVLAIVVGVIALMVLSAIFDDGDRGAV